MSSFPGAHRTLQGALVAVDPDSLAPTVVAFQYNPHTLTRSMEVRAAEGGPQGFGLAGAPVETISVEVEIDATDQLEASDATAASLGVHPQLAALERLITPTSTSVLESVSLANSGALEILPASGPIILFVWGPQRVLQVRIQQFSVTEEAFDANLNPIRARVSLGLRVLTTDDLASGQPGHALHLAHQIAQEARAAMASTGSLDAVLGSGVTLL